MSPFVLFLGFALASTLLCAQERVALNADLDEEVKLDYPHSSGFLRVLDEHNPLKDHLTIDPFAAVSFVNQEDAKGQRYVSDGFYRFRLDGDLHTADRKLSVHARAETGEGQVFTYNRMGIGRNPPGADELQTDFYLNHLYVTYRSGGKIKSDDKEDLIVLNYSLSGGVIGPEYGQTGADSNTNLSEKSMIFGGRGKLEADFTQDKVRDHFLAQTFNQLSLTLSGGYIDPTQKADAARYLDENFKEQPNYFNAYGEADSKFLESIKLGLKTGLGYTWNDGNHFAHESVNLNFSQLLPVMQSVLFQGVQELGKGGEAPHAFSVSSLTGFTELIAGRPILLKVSYIYRSRDFDNLPLGIYMYRKGHSVLAQVLFSNICPWMDIEMGLLQAADGTKEQACYVAVFLRPPPEQNAPKD